MFQLPDILTDAAVDDLITRLELVAPADFTVAPHRCLEESIRPGAQAGRFNVGVRVCTSCGLVRLWSVTLPVLYSGEFLGEWRN